MLLTSEPVHTEPALPPEEVMAQGAHLSEPRVYAEAEAGFRKPSSGRGHIIPWDKPQ